MTFLKGSLCIILIMTVVLLYTATVGHLISANQNCLTIRAIYILSMGNVRKSNLKKLVVWFYTVFDLNDTYPQYASFAQVV